MTALKLLGIDAIPDRRVALAVELLDPVSGRIVSNGITVSLEGSRARPIVNASGRFVWIGDADTWPASLSVDCGIQPYQSIANRSLAAARPPGWPLPEPHKRLVSVRLTPTNAYPFSDGVTAIQGWLFENTPRAPIEDAEMWFEWAVAGTSAWQPIDPSRRARTDRQGRFSLYTRINGTAVQAPDVSHGLVKVRLFVTRGTKTQRTKDSFQFLPPPAAPGRIPDGMPLDARVDLDWGELVNP